VQIREQLKLTFDGAMFNMRSLPAAASEVLDLSEVEQQVLAYVAEGLSPKEIAERGEISEDELYRLVAWVLDELEPAPNGETMATIHERHGSGPASSEDLEEFERRFGPSLPPDGEG
jgi:DNA-binding CsgD family transcriptional regulator